MKSPVERPSSTFWPVEEKRPNAARWLRFSVFNDGEAFDINLRIHDQPYVRSEMVYSDRYNQRLTLEAGWNHFAVPLEEIERGPATRLMDMSQVWAVWFFVHDLGREASLYLDDIRLEKH